MIECPSRPRKIASFTFPHFLHHLGFEPNIFYFSFSLVDAYSICFCQSIGHVPKIVFVKDPPNQIWLILTWTFLNFRYPYISAWSGSSQADVFIPTKNDSILNFSQFKLTGRRFSDENRLFFFFSFENFKISQFYFDGWCRKKTTDWLGILSGIKIIV